MIVPEGERVTVRGEIAALLNTLYLLGKVMVAWCLALVMWNAAQLVAQAARVYERCGYVYFEADVLPRCMRELIHHRWWLDLIR